MQNSFKMVTVVLCLSLSACASSFSYFPFIYRPDVQQGNVFSKELVDRIKLGMTVDQVRYFMGNPVLVNSFSKGRFEYVYTFKPRRGAMQRKEVTIYFVNGRVSRVSQS